MDSEPPVSQVRRRRVPPPDNPSPLSPRQLRWIMIITVVGVLYKLASQLSPFYILPSIPALPSPHQCAIHASDLRNCTFAPLPPPSVDILLSCMTGLYHFSPSFPASAPTLISPIASSSISLSSSSRLLTVSIDAVNIFDLSLTPKLTLSLTDTIALPGVRSITAGASDAEFYATTNPSNSLLDLVTGQAIHVSLSPLTITPIVRIPSARGIAFDKRTGMLHIASNGRGVYGYYVSSLPAMVRKFHRTVGLLPGELMFSEDHGLFASMKADGKGSFAVQLLDGKAKHRDLANAGLRLSEWYWKTAFVDNGGFYAGEARTAGVVGGRFVVGGLGSGIMVCEAGIPVKLEVDVADGDTVKDEL